MLFSLLLRYGLAARGDKLSNDALASVAVLAVAASVTALPQFLPRLIDVHHADADSSFAMDVRIGEAVTVTFFLSIGLIASSIAGSADPFYASMVLSLFIVTAYETTLQNNFGTVTE